MEARPKGRERLVRHRHPHARCCTAARATQRRAERALRAVGAQLALPQPPPERSFHFGSSFAARRKAPSTLDSAGEVMQSLARRIGWGTARRIGFVHSLPGLGLGKDARGRVLVAAACSTLVAAECSHRPDHAIH